MNRKYTPRHRKETGSLTRRTVAAAAALVVSGTLLMALAGCGTSGEPVPEQTTGEVSKTSEPRTSSTTNPEKPKQQDPHFGQSYRYDDGLVITVDAPIKLADAGDGISWDEWAEWEDIPDGHYPGKITMRLTNETGETIDPSLATITVLSGETELEAECFGDGVQCGTMLTKLRPGKSLTMSWSYWIPENGDVTVEAAPTWDHDPAVFTAKPEGEKASK